MDQRGRFRSHRRRDARNRRRHLAWKRNYCDGDDVPGPAQEYVARLGGSIRSRIGLHLQLTDGTPLSAPDTVPSLVDDSGRFVRKGIALQNVNSREVLREWRLQLAAIRSLGFEPTHIDSHHDVHWQPGALEAYIELAREERLTVRGGPDWLVKRLRAEQIPCVAMTWTFGDRSSISIDGLIEEVKQVAAACPGDGVLEIACHPGFVDDELLGKSALVEQRGEELAVLCSPELPRRLAAIGFELARLGQ